MLLTICFSLCSELPLSEQGFACPLLTPLCAAWDNLSRSHGASIYPQQGLCWRTQVSVLAQQFKRKYLPSVFPVLLWVFTFGGTWQRRKRDEKLGISGKMLRGRGSQGRDVDGWRCSEQEQKEELSWKSGNLALTPHLTIAKLPVITRHKDQGNPRLQSPNRQQFVHSPVFKARGRGDLGHLCH